MCIYSIALQPLPFTLAFTAAHSKVSSTSDLLLEGPFYVVCPRHNVVLDQGINLLLRLRLEAGLRFIRT